MSVVVPTSSILHIDWHSNHIVGFDPVLLWFGKVIQNHFTGDFSTVSELEGVKTHYSQQQILYIFQSYLGSTDKSSERQWLRKVTLSILIYSLYLFPIYVLNGEWV